MTAFGSVKEVSARHFWKALWPIVVTVAGSVREVRELQDRNSLLSMAVKERFGSVTEVRLQQALNASGPISFTPRGTTAVWIYLLLRGRVSVSCSGSGSGWFSGSG